LAVEGRFKTEEPEGFKVPDETLFETGVFKMPEEELELEGGFRMPE